MQARIGSFVMIALLVTISAASAQDIFPRADGNPDLSFQAGVTQVDALASKHSTCQIGDSSAALETEQIQLGNGSVLKFTAYPDGSVSVSEQGTAGNEQLLSDPAFENATIADVYWAITTDERPMPEFLVTNHHKVAEDPFAGLSEGRERGWWLHRPPRRSMEKVDNCISGVQNFVCNTNAASYPSGPGCFDNIYGSAAWYNNSDEVRRYRTGVCSHGTYDANIWFGYAGPSHCDYFQVAYLKHVGRFTSTYYLYAWSGPSGSWPRSYRNSVSYVSGGPFDWGVKYKLHTSSSCTI